MPHEGVTYGPTQWVEAQPCVVLKTKEHSTTYVSAAPQRKRETQATRRDARPALRINCDEIPFRKDSLLSPLACKKNNETSLQ